MKRTTNWAHFIAMQAGVVPISFGMPGVAKTAMHRSLATTTNRYFVQLILRQLLPEDIHGCPSPGKIEIDGVAYDGVNFLLCDELLRAHHQPSIVLLDELNQSGGDVLGAAQELINNPPANCWMAAASNPVEQSTSGVELAPPVVNRMCVLDWEIPWDAIEAGWLDGCDEYPEPELPILPPREQWKPMRQGYGKLMQEFRSKRPDLFGEAAFPKDISKASEPWPSPRSWTNVITLMAAADSVWASASVKAKLAYGCVGAGAGNEWLEFLGTNDLPNPEDLLARPDTLKLPLRFDLQRAIIASVIHAVRENNTGDRWERAYDVLETAFDQSPECGMSAEGALWRVKTPGHEPRARNGRASEMRKLRLGA